MTVEVRGVVKAFGPVEVLRGVSLSVEPGSVTAVLGPSGCGKTTLLRVIGGFERPDAGTVHVGGRDVTRTPAHERRIAMVPQEGALFPHLSVAANVGFGLPRASRRGPRVEELLDLAGLGGLGGRMPYELSGGQQQRVAVARALAPQPSVVLLDEPFSALDAGLRASIRDDVLGLLRAHDTTAILVTHDQDEALSAADVVAVMRSGLIVQAAPPAEVYAAPVDLDVARFLGDANVLRGTYADGVVACPLGRVPASGSGTEVDVLVRPEHLAIGEAGVRGVVTGRRYFGHDAMVTVRLADGTEARVRTPLATAYAPGDEVGVACTGPVVAYPVAATTVL
ncbi:MAG TPA: ABC transporter ATP-binding protein [Frankiaceae bacterium]|nr:ABC transporter ATP-binding protein [Frankiaceae bacterium]